MRDSASCFPTERNQVVSKFVLVLLTSCAPAAISTAQERPQAPEQTRTSRNEIEPSAAEPGQSLAELEQHYQQVERHVLALLSAGQQGDAEDIVRTEVLRMREALEITKLLAENRRQDAEQFLAARREVLERQQRLVFLLGALLRSRFDRMSQPIFDTVILIDPQAPAAQCAAFVNRLDTTPRTLKGAVGALHTFNQFGRFVDSHPDEVVLRWMLAVECRHWNRNAPGAEQYRLILEKWNPGPALVHQTYANLLDNLGRYDEAARERYIVVEMEPASWSYDGLGNTLKKLGRYPEAIAAHEKAVRLDPDDAQQWVNWGLTLVADKQFAAAADKCAQAVELDPNSWRAYWTWAQALKGQNRPREAFAKYKQALELYPGHPTIQREALELRAELIKQR